MTKRINLDINADLWKRVAVRCAETEMMKKEFVEKALEKLLKETKK
jgi:Arc/MetJ family transcription regulator